MGSSSKKSSRTSGRWDLFVYNDARGFVVASKRQAGRAASISSEKKWTRAVETAEILPFKFASKGDFIVRVVVNDELTQQEAEEWVGRLVWKLKVPDGKLAISDGDILIREGIPDDEDEIVNGRVVTVIPKGSYGSFHIVSVPPGEYRVEFLNYLTGAPTFLPTEIKELQEETLKEYFRRTRGKQKPPAWIVDARAEHGKNRLRYVDFLLHLTPLKDKGDLSKAAVGGTLSATEVRKPARCPFGLEAKDVIGEPKPSPPPRIATINVEPRVREYALAPVEGGYVRYPVERIAHVYRLAWFSSNAATNPEIRVTLPSRTRFDPRWPEVQGTAVRPIEGGFKIGFKSERGDSYFALRSMWDYGSTLVGLPEGSVLELMCAGRPRKKADPRIGLQRYRGVVGGGTWHISETYPQVDASQFREALALVAGIGEKALPVRDESEANAVLELLKKTQPYASEVAPLKLDGLNLRPATKYTALIEYAVTCLFRRRYSQIWPT